MARKPKAGRRAVARIAHDLSRLIDSIRRLKDRLKGKEWRRAHRIESELSTLAGLKTPMTRTAFVSRAKAGAATRTDFVSRARYKKLLEENEKLKAAAK